jgi:HD-GYP domain-containing protein (c-di-GMP phosphodiesterase class II)
MPEDPSRGGITGPRSTRASKGFEEEASRLGRDMVTQLYVLIRNAQIHDPGNVALNAPTENLMQTLKRLWKFYEKIDLHLVGDYLYMDEIRLRMDIERLVSFTGVIEELKRIQIGGLVFFPKLGTDELRRFVSVFTQIDPKGSDSFQLAKEQIRSAGITNVEVEEFEEKKEEYKTLQADAKAQAKSSYFKTITTVSEVMGNIKIGKAVSVKRAKRSVQNMVDVLLADESTLLGLTTLRCHDVYTHNHSVNVCILSLAMGQRLGYSKEQLSTLGMAGLFHDMGKANIPLEVLNKATEFTEEDWQHMRRHPIEGVKYLLRFKGINDTTIRMVTGVFEHHLNYDLSGYPKLLNPWKVSVIGRILSIVDCYDALTSSRVYNRTPYPPDKALKFMLSKGGKAFDPILLKVFVNSIGIFPIGTLVLLSTHEMAVVTETHPNVENAERPRVKIIADSKGNQIDGEVVALSDEKEISRRSILKTLDPAQYKIDISWYFAS